MGAGEDAPRAQRPRRAPSRLDTGGDTAALQQAMRKSLVETRRAEVAVPSAPVFYPTMDEFRDPLAFIAAIRPAAERYGIAKVVPPPGWHQAFADPLASCPHDFETKQQQIHQLQEGQPFGEGPRYTLASYRAQADAFKTQWLFTHPVPPGVSEAEHIEREYWRIVECSDEPTTVDYANDLDTGVYGSGFSAPATGLRDSWDLNRLIEHPENLLRAVGACLPGVTRPWLYMGMLFATFCWHTEDHHLYSINYLHHGASKSWYGIPGASSAHFTRALRQCVPRLFDEAPDLLHRLTTLLSPSACKDHGVDVVHAVQHAGEFMITFPAAFHAGFSHGFNCAEAVNIADTAWLPHGRAAVENYRSGSGKRAALFAHEQLLWVLHSCCRAASSPRLLRVPQHAHQVVQAELALHVQEQLRLRAWLRKYSVPEAAVPEAAACDDECEACGTVPFFAAVRCACNPARLACLHHGLALCDCPVGRRTLEVRVADSVLQSVLGGAHHPAAIELAAVRAAVPHAAQPPAKRARADAAAGGLGGAAHPVARDAPKPSTAVCSECGGFAGRGGLLRCMSCDAAFHRKCADQDVRPLSAADVCLCPSCWDAQR